MQDKGRDNWGANSLQELTKPAEGTLGAGQRTERALEQDSGPGGNPPNALSEGGLDGREEPDLESDTAALNDYREAMIQYYGSIALPGAAQRSADERALALNLRQVYVDPDTEFQVSDSAVRQALMAGQILPIYCSALERPEDLRPLSALEAVALNKRLLLLGGPGSGKTMFVRGLCLALAGNEPLGLGQWGSRRRLPLVIHLGDFSQWLRTKSSFSDGDASALWDFVCHDLQERQLGFAVNSLQAALEEGYIHLLLDGLDEVRPEWLRAVLRTLTVFEQRYPQIWLLVTCRTLYYEQASWHLPGDRFTALRLAPFDRAKIQRYLTAWHRELDGGEDHSKKSHRDQTARFSKMLRQPSLARLAGNPLLLNLMTLVYSYDKALPGYRSALYERAVDLLLWRWHAGPETEEPDLLSRLREAGRGGADLLRVLRWFAATAYGEHGSETDKLIDNSDLLMQALVALHPHQDADWARGLIEHLYRSGLLREGEPGTSAFYCRPLQEYLAGVYLALNRSFVPMATRLAGEGGLWREVILLAVGYRVHVQGELDTALELVGALCPPREPQTDKDWRTVQLAGEIVLEIGLERTTESREPGARSLRRMRRQLTALLERGKLEPLERLRVGEIVGRLGDPRFDPHRLYLPCRYNSEPDRGGGFVRIPAGSFWMGGGENNEQSQLMQISYAYWIGRYPVTVAQFAAFVADAGYADQRWWGSEIASRWLKETRAINPGEWNKQSRHPNRPVTQVSWFEASAYCAWLDARLRALDRDPLPPDCQIRLPTETEWARAARGKDPLPYPWGYQDWDEQRANVQEGNIGHATPVGIYPQGATASGLYDLAGNIWEWTLSDAEDQPGKSFSPADNAGVERRVLCGGSWSDPRSAARCTSRGVDFTIARDAAIGFRVVVSLIKPGQ